MQSTISLYIYFVQYSFLKNSFLFRLPIGLLKNYEPWAEEMRETVSMKSLWRLIWERNLSIQVLIIFMFGCTQLLS